MFLISCEMQLLSKMGGMTHEKYVISLSYSIKFFKTSIGMPLECTKEIEQNENVHQRSHILTRFLQQIFSLRYLLYVHLTSDFSRDLLVETRGHGI